MYILIALFFSAGSSSAVSSSFTQEHTSYQACLDAKAAIENAYPVTNYRTLKCVAK